MDPYVNPSNPYAVSSDAGAASTPAHQPHYSSVVQQVMPFGIVLMVHGGLFIFAGLMAIGFTVMMWVMNEEMDLEEFEALIVLTIYGGGGLLILIGGIVQCLAGWRAIQFRNYILAFFGIGTAALGMFTCYCGPTGIALAIWGMILLLHDDVRYAFELAKHRTREEVLRHFSYSPQNWMPPQQPPYYQGGGYQGDRPGGDATEDRP